MRSSLIFTTLFPLSLFPMYSKTFSDFYFSLIDMIDKVSRLRSGKSYVGFIMAEHVMHGSPKLMIHLQILFNAMLQHSFIPALKVEGATSVLM